MPSVPLSSQRLKDIIGELKNNPTVGYDALRDIAKTARVVLKETDTPASTALAYVLATRMESIADRFESDYMLAGTSQRLMQDIRNHVIPALELLNSDCSDKDAVAYAARLIAITVE